MSESSQTSGGIQHHVPDEEVLAYVAGTSTDGASLAIGCHSALCVACSTRIAEIEALGGALLEASGEAALPPDAFASVLARIDVEGPPKSKLHVPTPPEVPELLRPYHLPGPLRNVLGRTRARLRWHLVIPGVRAIDLNIGMQGSVVRLVAFKGGITIPLHDHGGPEYIVVFTGALEEDGARFARGDISIRDSGDRHEQRVAAGEPCVALVVNEGKLQPMTLRGRILLALSRQ